MCSGAVSSLCRCSFFSFSAQFFDSTVLFDPTVLFAFAFLALPFWTRPKTRIVVLEDCLFSVAL